MVLERCTNAVASPFGVTGALRAPVAVFNENVATSAPAVYNCIYVIKETQYSLVI